MTLHEVLEYPPQVRDKRGMTYRVSPEALRAGIAHLSRYGDTDIFPHLPEITFSRTSAMASSPSWRSLTSTPTRQPVASNASAKGRYSFRIAHQLPALDTLLLLVCVIEIGSQIEAKRQSSSGARAFSIVLRWTSIRGKSSIPIEHTRTGYTRQKSFVATEKRIGASSPPTFRIIILALTFTGSKICLMKSRPDTEQYALSRST